MKGQNKMKNELKKQFFKNNHLFYIIALFGAFLGGTLNLILSWIMQQLLDSISNPEKYEKFYELLIVSISFFLLCIVTFLIKYFAEPTFVKKGISQYKERVFEKITNKKITAFDNESMSMYISSLTNDVVTIESGYLRQQIQLVTQMITFIGAFIMMLCCSIKLTIIVILLTLLPLWASVLTGNKLEVVEKNVSDKNAEFVEIIKEFLTGFTIIKSFNAERECISYFWNFNNVLEEEKYNRNRITIIIGMIGASAGVMAQLGVFIAGAYLAIRGEKISVGTIILFVNLMNFIIEPIATLPGLLANKKAANGLIDKLIEALEENIENVGTERISNLKNEIKLEHVNFGYDVNNLILKDINYKFEKGKKYAIVGASGSGKSTLINLLLGGETGYIGDIYIDGIELKQIDLASLYNVITVMQQDVFLFNSTVEENITMFKKFSSEEINGVIEQACLQELVNRREENSLCGERGCNLSGGEKQRVSIARCLLKKSQILLVDEATSALDNKTAYEINKTLLALDGVTTLVVMHSLEKTILEQYDEILVLKEGKIVETGKFNDLIKNKNYFYALYTIAN